MWKVGGAWSKDLKYRKHLVQNSKQRELRNQIVKKCFQSEPGAKEEVAWGEVVSEEVQNRLPTPLPPLSSRR